VTWSPFKGCRFDCTYCVPSFQRQAKRQKHRCDLCYSYEPHEHEERLRVGAIPSSAKIVFVAANGDLAFAEPAFIERIIDVIREKNERRPELTYFLQSKRPACFARHCRQLPSNVVLLTTLETNRDVGYRRISKAPLPSVRHRQFLALDHSRKVITIEPLLDFDLKPFVSMMADASPEYVWLGLNSRPRELNLPEPSSRKIQTLVSRLKSNGIPIRFKDLRDIKPED
jgi:protein gp37